MQIYSQINSLQVYKQSTDKNSQAQSSGTIQSKSGGISSGSTAQSDSITLSADAKLLAEASRVAASSDASRASMVAGLREQVQNGTYVMDDASIAQGILREDVALFTA